MRTFTLAALILAACSDASPPGFSTGPAITSVSASTSGSSTGGDTSSIGPADDSAGSSASASTSTSTSAGTLDVGTVMDFGPVQPPGCKGKVDLLFVISRQGTMQTEQTQLLASFAGFIETIEQKLEGFDVHIMTANPDGNWPGQYICESENNLCKDYWPNCGPTAQDYQCGIYPDLVTKCDKVLGAGLIFNTGGYAANKLCDLQDGKRYIMSGQPDLPGAFECIAKVGVSGGAAMGDAMIAALSPALNGPGGCNEGFLREDALLVVALITDSNYDPSKSYAKQYEAIVAAKGDPGAVVMLAVVKNAPGDFEPAEKCDYWGEPSYGTFEDLLSRFPYKVFGDTCTSSFAPFFDQATDKISEACGSYIPQ